MSRPNTMSRNLSLTEELEKLEQSITLTLQGISRSFPSLFRSNHYLEIDHNFSRAHRIVTTSILPIVEQYAEHSNAVWEGSKVWSSRCSTSKCEANRPQSFGNNSSKPAQMSLFPATRSSQQISRRMKLSYRSRKMATRHMLRLTREMIPYKVTRKTRSELITKTTIPF